MSDKTGDSKPDNTPSDDQQAAARKLGTDMNRELHEPRESNPPTDSARAAMTEDLGRRLKLGPGGN